MSDMHIANDNGATSSVDSKPSKAIHDQSAKSRWEVRTGLKTLKQKLVKHRVVVDMNPDVRMFVGVPQWVQLELHKGGEWFCCYRGFLDATQLEAIRSAYEVIEEALSPMMQELNQKLREMKSTAELDSFLNAEFGANPLGA